MANTSHCSTLLTASVVAAHSKLHEQEGDGERERKREREKDTERKIGKAGGATLRCTLHVKLFFFCFFSLPFFLQSNLFGGSPKRKEAKKKKKEAKAAAAAAAAATSSMIFVVGPKR